MQHSGFVHLHVHSYYSLLDGANPIHRLAEKATAYRMPALALTDHANLFGAVEFYQTMSKAGVKPIIGCEVYLLTKGSRHTKAPRQDGMLAHLTLLVKNQAGYRNLCRMLSSAYLEGFYYKPRIDRELLNECHEGLIALSGCLSGEIPRLLKAGDKDAAREAAKDYAKLFDGDRFYLEVQDQGLPGQAQVRAGLIELGREVGLPLVATNDVHYPERADAAAHDALLCIQTAKVLTDSNRMRMDSDEFYFNSPEEMAEKFKDIPEAIGNTLAVAQRCNLEMDFSTYHFPKFAPPNDKDLATYLEECAHDGLVERWPQIMAARKADEATLRGAYERRLFDELAMIKKMGFAGYFLIVADFINFAKSKSLPVGPGRGSAAGSLVAYCLKITDIDPLEHDLLFERFLNPERVSMPDMDIDFCMRRRDEVIQYVAEKYGNVSQIITFGKMKARAVVRDVGRVMNMPYGEVDRIAKLIPATLGMTLTQALEIEPRLKAVATGSPEGERLIAISKSLEGFPRHASTHAAGVVIGDRPLTEFLPLYRGSKDETITQFDMKAVEKVGLIKFDFLGLRTLTVIDDALTIIREREGKSVDIARIPLDDALVYAKLSEGDTAGIFQLESSGMTDLVMKLKPSAFSDIVALVALFRPGPLGSGMVDDFIARKHGRRKIKYDLPQLEPILKDTYGVIVYQEQVMRIASTLANFSLGDADILRRAMGKKKPEEMAKQKEKFLEGSRANKIPPGKAERIFDLMAKFAEYGFNKCVVGETELVDADTGEVFTVADLVKEGPGRKTLSCDAQYRMRSRKISAVISNGCNEVYSLETHLGHRIVATDNHPFLTIHGWKTLGELRRGDRIAAPRTMPVEGHDEWPLHEVVTLGWLLSEGNTCHPNTLYFYNNDQKLIDDFVEHAGSFPHTEARVYGRGDGRLEVAVNTGRRSHVPWNARDRDEREKDKPRRSGAYTWAEKLEIVGKKAGEKTIPPGVFKLGNAQLAVFLGRLWSGDGFIFSSSDTVPFYASASWRLCRQVQSLLLRFGIVSRLAHKSFKYRNEAKAGYALYLTGEESVRIFLETIGPAMIGRDDDIASLWRYLEETQCGQSSRDTIPWEVKYAVRDEKERSGRTWIEIEQDSNLSMRMFYGGKHEGKRGFRRDTIQKLGRHFQSDDLARLGNSDIYWDEVTNIQSEGKRETFDITVDDDHNFVADGLVVHNSHSAAYALVAYQTAYLKYHHRTAFMASMLTSEKDNTDKILAYIGDCKAKGINILPPDVNESMRDFSVVGEADIRFGLAAVKNVGESAIDSVIEARAEKGPFTTFLDFCERVDGRKANRRVLESLIKCGAFDFTKARRAQLMAALDRSMEIAAGHQRDRVSGQSRLFDLMGGGDAPGTSDLKLPNVPEWPERERLANEKESLGFYITGHPLAQLEDLLSQYATCDTATVAEVPDKREVSIGGMVAKMREITTKRGDRMGFVTLEDLKGTVEVVVFADLYSEAVVLIKSEKPLYVVGNADTDGESAKIIARSIMALSDVPEHFTDSIHFHLHAPETDVGHLQQLKNVIGRYPGTCPAFVHLIDPNNAETILKLPDGIRLSPTLELVKAVEKLFGHNITQFVPKSGS